MSQSVSREPASTPNPSTPPSGAPSGAVATAHPAYAVAPTYGRFYAPLAILSALLSVVPLYQPVIVSEGHVRTFGNLWEMAGSVGGGLAMLAILLLGTVVGLLATAAARPTRNPVLPAVIAGLMIPILLLLIGRPETGTPKPDLTPFANMGIMIAVFTITVATVHAIHLFQLNRAQPRPKARPVVPPNSGSKSLL